MRREYDFDDHERAEAARDRVRQRNPRARWCVVCGVRFDVDPWDLGARVCGVCDEPGEDKQQEDGQ